jgi:MraZ protein
VRVFGVISTIIPGSNFGVLTGLFRGMFLSTYDSKVDTKNRVSVPASFRKALGGDDVVCVWPSFGKSKQCLEGGSLKLVSNLYKSIRKMKPMDPRRQALEYGILGECKELQFDGAGGRIVLPSKFLKHANIGGEVSFVGLGERFEIWDKAALAAKRAEFLELAGDSSDLIESMDFDFDDGEAVA